MCCRAKSINTLWLLQQQEYGAMRRHAHFLLPSNAATDSSFPHWKQNLHSSPSGLATTSADMWYEHMRFFWQYTFSKDRSAVQPGT